MVRFSRGALAVCPMSHPLLRWPLAPMRHREGNVLKDQASCEKFRASPLNRVECEILDLLHATPRIWDAAHLFYGRDEEQTLNFVYDRVLRILQGEVRSVVAGLRQMGTKRTLRGKKRGKLAKLCGYLENNAHRMRYDAYL